MGTMTSPCRDCGTDTYPDPPEPGAGCEWYMLRDDLWKTAGAGRGYLCIACLEHRLGRQLTAADFTGAPVNSLSPAYFRYAWSERTPRLRARLLDGMDPGKLAQLAAELAAAELRMLAQAREDQ